MFEHTENILGRDRKGISLEVLMISVNGIAMQQSVVDSSLGQYIQGSQITFVPKNPLSSEFVANNPVANKFAGKSRSCQIGVFSKKRSAVSTRRGYWRCMAMHRQ